MKQISTKKWSLLGLALMTASVVIAAILPDKSNEMMTVNNGTLRDFSAGSIAVQSVWSCIPDADTVYSCTASISVTSSNVITDSYVNGNQTVGNTSVTGGQVGDQNSVVA